MANAEVSSGTDVWESQTHQNRECEDSCQRTFKLGAFSDISKSLGLCTVLPVCYMPLKSFLKPK